MLVEKYHKTLFLLLFSLSSLQCQQPTLGQLSQSHHHKELPLIKTVDTWLCAYSTSYNNLRRKQKQYSDEQAFKIALENACQHYLKTGNYAPVTEVTAKRFPQSSWDHYPKLTFPLEVVSRGVAGVTIYLTSIGVLTGVAWLTTQGLIKLLDC